MGKNCCDSCRYIVSCLVIYKKLITDVKISAIHQSMLFFKKNIKTWYEPLKQKNQKSFSQKRFKNIQHAIFKTKI